MGKGAAEPPTAPEPAPKADSARVEWLVGGMHCPSCAALIEETLVRDPGVHRATVDLADARASVTYDGTTLSVADLCAAGAGAGHTARPLASGDPDS